MKRKHSLMKESTKESQRYSNNNMPLIEKILKLTQNSKKSNMGIHE